MTKIDIFSGFLGAGKTTLIKKLIAEAFAGEKLVLIENEFGEIGIDGGFMQEAGIEVTEMNSGCICCSLVGDFGKALSKVIDEYHPDRILIEPSGVGKLSDVIRAVRNLGLEDVKLNSFTAVCDAGKTAMYMKNFGEFYNDQIENAAAIVMSHADKVSEEKLAAAVALVREHNPSCALITTSLDKLTGADILAVINGTDTLEEELKKLEREEHHRHGEECDDEECECHRHHHHEEDDEHEHHHHHHHDEEECDDEECECHHHHHHEEDDDHEHHHHHHHEEDECDEHEHHHHHHHHHADDVFVSFGRETSKKYDRDTLADLLARLDDADIYGNVLRAKGIVEATDGSWIHFDYVPGEPDVRSGCAGAIGRLCVIGAQLNEHALEELFGL